MDADGTGARQVTANGAANWAPFLHPDGERIVFSSNLHDPGRFDFALYLIRRDGRGLERLTYAESFAAFPMFSPDGRRLVFCSSRGARPAARVQRLRRRLGGLADTGRPRRPVRVGHRVGMPAGQRLAAGPGGAVRRPGRC